ncbi:hypothetical protein DSO57_1036106 [Entomophthora muscae]|uniref:Uncharacterized protein n=1 Tax=Entomophthora muscae TaxID=34485 RepID=A0ACC2TYS6_9FUNG|nr:hypothetical protein DSO57_1036106 [Entomophthora muscae]
MSLASPTRGLPHPLILTSWLTKDISLTLSRVSAPSTECSNTLTCGQDPNESTAPNVETGVLIIVFQGFLDD